MQFKSLLEHLCNIFPEPITLWNAPHLGILNIKTCGGSLTPLVLQVRPAAYIYKLVL